MALRAIPIRRAGNRENLFMGGDRELVMFSGLLAGALIFSAQELKAAVFGSALWFGALFALRLMAKADPKLRHVYLRHRRYKPYYPARSTPFHDNTLKSGEAISMIEAIAVAIAALGAVLLLILFARIQAVDAELKLKKHRAKDAGLADLLNYAAVVDDGVIVGKNGSFMAAWLYKGDDNAGSTEEQREIVSFRINQTLAGLGNGRMISVDAVRRPAPNYSERGVSSFTDSVSFAIDEERRRLFEGLGAMFEGYFVLTVTWFPPMLAQRKFVELMFDDDAAAPDRKARTTGLISQFKREITVLESRLSSAVKMTRLRGQKAASEEGREVTHDDLSEPVAVLRNGPPSPGHAA